MAEADGRSWVAHPSNGFAAYRAIFPKGHADGDIERTKTMTRHSSPGGKKESESDTTLRALPTTNQATQTPQRLEDIVRIACRSSGRF